MKRWSLAVVLLCSSGCAASSPPSRTPSDSPSRAADDEVDHAEPGPIDERPPPNEASPEESRGEPTPLRARTTGKGGAADAPPAKLPPGCLRQHKGVLYRCSGMAPRPGEPNSVEVMVCDNCITDNDCTEHPGGRCISVGGQACTGASHMECRYPSAECGGQICPERVYPPPPSMAPGR